MLNGLELNALKSADLYVLELKEKKIYFQKPIQSYNFRKINVFIEPS